MKPGQRTFDHPAGHTQAAAVIGVTASNQRRDSSLAKRLAMSVGVVAAVSLDHFRAMTRMPHLSAYRRDGIDQWEQLRHIVAIRPGQDHSERNAVRIRDRVVLRAVFPAIRGVGADFRPPKTARTELLSTMARDQSIWSAALSFARSAVCNLSHTPACCQSRRRRQQVIPLPQPISWGRSSQPMPVLSTNRMPVRALRLGPWLTHGGRPG